MAKIQLLTGPAVDDALEETAVRHLFRYRLNPATVGLLFLFAVVCFIGALYLLFGPGLGGGNTVGFAISLAMGLTFFSMVSFWSNFQTKQFIAISDDYLYVGKDDKAWSIHWSLVDRNTLKLDSLQNSRLHGKIYLETVGQTVEIPLYTPFVFLEEIEELMFELLQRLEAEGGEKPVGAPGQNLDPAEFMPDEQNSEDQENSEIKPPSTAASK